jgi:transcriptional regulator with XRE-family HTH domain
MNEFNTDRQWLRQKAEEENGCDVSVSGSMAETAPERERSTVLRPVFGLLIQLARRERRLTLEQFSERADIDLVELVSIEQDERFHPTPRSVHQLAKLLGIPAPKLMALAGLLRVKDPDFQRATIRFAARAEPLKAPTPEEHAAFEEYVKLLCDK